MISVPEPRRGDRGVVGGHPGAPPPGAGLRRLRAPAAPARARCARRCGRTDALGHHEASGTGAVDAVTVVERSPGPDHPAPYALARVRLAEGVVLLSQVETERPHDVAIGDRLALHWRDLADGRALPVFRPTEETP